ncbi:predicted protein [Nematostella vectensis]|uniref:Nucleolar protein 6 n=1 Tax=Nematostella vectensis TaxID=45351 RepID=A7S7H5_NEMVE|nr:predicted protein [Nematostella vectensis]|eukprot:XP_001632372.1 predicted protein [Nematostella vectensis]
MKRANEIMAGGREKKKTKDDGKMESLYRPLTSEELGELKETEQLFHSSLIRLQIKELIEEIQIKKKNEALEDTLHALNEVLLAIPDGKKEYELSDMSWLPRKVVFPLPPTPSPVKGKFKFLKPAAVNIVGSYQLKTAIKPSFNVDVSINMPKECFQDKDYLNMRYLHKRAAYLCVVAHHVIKSKLFQTVRFVNTDGDILRPVLSLKPKGKAGKNCTVRIHPVISNEVFKLQRLAPNKSNVRLNWLFPEASSSSVLPTPHYNSLILRDMVLGGHLRCLFQCMNDCPSAREAIMLLSVWLRQRELDEGQGGFSRFLVSMVIAHLHTTRKINSYMSSYQIVRIFLQFISSSDWTTCTAMKKDQNSDENNLPSLSCHHAAFDVVFVDPSGYLNLCANVSKSTYYRVRHEAKLSFHLLDDRFVDGFYAMFMKPVPFMQKFDQCFSLANIECLKNVTERVELQPSILSHAGDWVPVAVSWLVELLHKGLGKRAEMIYVKPSACKEWSVRENPPTLQQDSVTIGLILDTDHSDSILDYGPPGDNTLEAAIFREFWGSKSELRRFKDGSILEAVVWPSSSAGERRTVCERIIKYLLNRHGKVEPEMVRFVSSQLDCLLQRNNGTSTTPSESQQAPTSSSIQGTGEESMSLVIKAYDSLCKDIRGLELPLAVHSLQGISPIFRGAEVHPPNPCISSPQSKNSHQDKENNRNMASSVALPTDSKVPPWCPVMTVLLQFETSGKWPDDLAAIKHVKAAFHIRLAQQLKEKLGLVAATSPTCVDVVKDGFVFRVKIVHYREMVLLQEPGDEIDSHLRQSQAVAMEKEIVWLPALTSTLHGIQQQFVAYSGCVRLAMRWVCSQLLFSHIPSECVELLVASLFLSPAPLTPPHSALCGFMRFLHVLATCDWKTTPIIVNFNNDLTAENYQEISSKFSSNRAHLPPLFISTPKDRFDSKWTRNAPSSMILQRVRVLAQESYNVMKETLESTEPPDLKPIFRPPIDGYDVIITLHSRMLPRRDEAVDVDKPLKKKAHSARNKADELPVVDFDPAECYLRELREAFSDIALFFHDPHGGDMIAVLWRPNALSPALFKVLHAEYKAPVKESLTSSKKRTAHAPTVEPNIPAILEDFKIIGEGLVKSVQSLKKNTDQYMNTP